MAVIETPRQGSGSIVTPEAVVLDFELAGVSSRALASTIDVTVQVIGLLLLALFTQLAAGGSQVTAIVMMLIGIIVVLFGYPVAMETLNAGRSLGRMVVGTRVVTVEGAPVRFRHAFIRALLAIIDLLASSGAIAVVTALVTRRGQRLGDVVAGTMVIRERKRVGLGWSHPFFAAPQLRSWARNMDTAPLGDDGYQLIRDFLRREDLADKEHGQVARELEAFVTERLPLWPRPEGATIVDWLRTIAATAQGSGGLAPPAPRSAPVSHPLPPPGATPPPPAAAPPPPAAAPPPPKVTPPPPKASPVVQAPPPPPTVPSPLPETGGMRDTGGFVPPA